MPYQMIGSVPKYDQDFKAINMAMDKGSRRYEIGDPNREIGQIVSDRELWTGNRPSLIGKVQYLL
ncbi:MAG: hypothetical protein IH934_00355 [Nanoarchaeota archaeon]|nr:hypothetical protein [Nanoarchaeota archaeon]